jgi:hypothetical protein
VLMLYKPPGVVLNSGGEGGANAYGASTTGDKGDSKSRSSSSSSRGGSRQGNGVQRVGRDLLTACHSYLEEEYQKIGRLQLQLHVDTCSSPPIATMLPNINHRQTPQSPLLSTLTSSGNAFLGPCHFIDKPVSGVVVTAKSSKAARRLAKHFRGTALLPYTLLAVQSMYKHPPTHFLILILIPGNLFLFFSFFPIIPRTQRDRQS